MSSAGDERSRISPDLSPLTLGLASLAAVVATLVVSRFGLAGTVAGAALTPVLVTVVREVVRRPAERVTRLPSGARVLTGRVPRVRPRVVVLTSLLAFVIAVAAFTIPDLLRGSSVVSDRDSTFFGGGGGGGGGGATTTTPTTRTDTTGATVEAPTTAPEEGVTAPLPEITVPTITAPPATTVPAPVAPPTPTAPAPAATAPASPVPPAAP